MSELASWIPPGVTITLIFALSTALYRMLNHFTEVVLGDIRAVKMQLDNIGKELGEFATLEQLGRMGDRFDARHAATNEAMGALRERLGRVEGKIGGVDD